MVLNNQAFFAFFIHVTTLIAIGTTLSYISADQKRKAALQPPQQDLPNPEASLNMSQPIRDAAAFYSTPKPPSIHYVYTKRSKPIWNKAFGSFGGAAASKSSADNFYSVGKRAVRDQLQGGDQQKKEWNKLFKSFGGAVA
ncbi:UNVERIFIED_CONTAM: hypothetical protein HDU68_009322 [Siphonaria sp. JEL0065]|nr:hypothetical protein HDU68_009322 [Siphonaria sp. JEL0065]